jgi:hypothetical protein
VVLRGLRELEATGEPVRVTTVFNKRVLPAEVLDATRGGTAERIAPRGDTSA